MPAFDFKREYRDLYRPGTKPALVEVPAMGFFAATGSGDPNEEGGAYGRALEVLYALSYAVKMSKKGAWQPEGYFDYVVPPLEGLWWAGAGAFDGTRVADKGALSWVSLIRQPDFVTPAVFEWAREEVLRKKPELQDRFEEFGVRFVRFAEGTCAQVMHLGPYDTEAETVGHLSQFIDESEFVTDISEGGESPEGHGAARVFDPAAALEALDADGGEPGLRLHHEIYLGDPRRTAPERLRTVIRHPVRRA